jgi:hypothetical protein
VVDAPEILAVIGKVPHLSEFLNSLYNCQYKSFFVAFCKSRFILQRICFQSCGHYFNKKMYMHVLVLIPVE